MLIDLVPVLRQPIDRKERCITLGINVSRDIVFFQNLSTEHTQVI